MARPSGHRALLLAIATVGSAATAASPAHAQYAAAARIGISAASVSVGRVQLSASGSVGRHVSWATPRTVLTLGTDAMIGSPAAGFSLGLAAEGAAEADSLPPVIALHGAVWHSVGNLTLHLDVSERALRFGGRAAGTQVNQYWTDSLETDSGFVAYGELRTDTVPLPGTASHENYWPELQAGAEWSSGRLTLDALIGGRNSVATLPRAVWGHVGASLVVAHGLALDASAGRSPARIGLGVPESRYVSVAVHIAPGRAAGPASAKPAAVRPPRFAVRPIGAQRYTVSYVGADLDAVAISGDFNDWTPIALHAMGRDRDRWQTTLTLAPGVYHMSLRLNGGPWVAPPGMPAVSDDFGGAAGIVVVH